MPFPVGLLNHVVTVYRRSVGKDTDSATVETSTALGQAMCSITSVTSRPGPNDQDGTVWSATLTGTNPILAGDGLYFVVVRGPMPAGTKLYPDGRRNPHGNAYIDQFHRFGVSSTPNV